EASYREILSQLQEALPDAQIIVTSVLPVTAAHAIHASEILDLNERLEVVCQEEQVTYLDLFTAFSDEENCLRAEYALDDVHLTVQGYRLWLSTLDTMLSWTIQKANY
ncbi:MAG: GDSL-type esterase/lipase family protein, partial [Angelakisella sp.]